MEVPARYFLWFWIVIGISSLKLGFDVMDKTELSTTVPPWVIFWFSFLLSFSATHSCFYVFHMSRFNTYEDSYIIGFLVIYSFVFNSFEVSPMICSLILIVINTSSSLYSYIIQANLSLGGRMIVKTMYFSAAYNMLTYPYYNQIMKPTVVMEILLNEVHLAWLENLLDVRNKFHRYLLPITAADPTQENLFIFNKRKGKKWIKFAVGMVGTILFQYFFRLNSFKEILVFIYFAVSWLANLALVSPSDDFGVFNFLLGNVIVGSTVNEFGVGRSTWIAYGTCLLLYGLRLKLESLSLINREEEETQVVIW